jgi:hypothetical protein
MVPRPTSVFVDAGRFSQYLLILFFLGLGAIDYWRGVNQRDPVTAATKLNPSGLAPVEVASASAYRGRRSQRSSWSWSGRGGQAVLWVFLGLITVGLFVSAQRAALVMVVLCLVSIVLVAYSRRLRSWYERARTGASPLTRFAVIIAVAFIVFAALQPTRLEAVYRLCLETLSPAARATELTWRPKVYWQDIVLATKESGLFGHGTGTGSQGLQYVYGLDNMYSGPGGFNPYHVEGGYATVIWEWGMIGLVIWLWWTSRLVYVSFQMTSGLRDTRFYWLGLTVSVFFFCFHFPHFFFGMNVYQNYVANSYHWFLLGMLFRLPMLTNGSRESQVLRA